MNRKTEKKILDEIRKSVLNKDNELKKRQEEKEIQQANIEALAEMTSLSESEVKQIAQLVRDEVSKDYYQKRKRNIYIFSTIAAIVLITVFFLYEPEPEVNIVEETFDTNAAGWDEFDEFKFKRYMKDNSYIFETNVDGWCYWDDIPVDLPINYAVEVRSKWQKGKFNSYGFSLLTSDDAYFSFQIRADGAAHFGKTVEGKWDIDDSWLTGKAYESGEQKSNVQRVEVRGINFKYLVNGNFVREGVLDLIINNIGLRSCGEQIIAFESIRVVDLDTDEVVFLEDFSTPNKSWNPCGKVTKHSRFENGSFIFKSNTADNCYWSTSQKYALSQNCEVSVATTWLKGESSSYGFMIMQDEENYILCSMINDGNARLVACEYDEYINIQNHVSTSFDSAGKNQFTQKIIIKDGMVQYFINDQFVQEIALGRVNPHYLGVRVCGKQTVAYDHLSVTIFE